MKVIKYAALKKNLGQYLQVKTRRKSLKPSSRTINYSRDIQFFFVNSRSVKSIRGGKKKSCRRLKKREKKHFKN